MMIVQPARFAPTTGTTVWSATNKSASLSVSNGGLTISYPSGGSWQSGRADPALNASKVYWENTCGTIGTAMQGLCNESWTSYVQPDSTNCWTYVSHGGTTTQPPGTYATWTTGDELDFAYDPGTGNIWARVNGVWQNSGNPAAGTGAIGNFTSGTKHCLAALLNAGNSFNTRWSASSWLRSPPAGFGPAP